MKTADHCDAMWFWLKDCGVNSHRAGIVRCLGEKVNTMIPGIYNERELM